MTLLIAVLEAAAIVAAFYAFAAWLLTRDERQARRRRWTHGGRP